MFTAIGIQEYEQISNMRNKTNCIKNIPYEDTMVLNKLIKYVSDDPSVVETLAVQSY